MFVEILLDDVTQIKINAYYMKSVFVFSPWRINIKFIYDNEII